MVAVIELKRYTVGNGVFYIIILKFRYWKKPSLVILFIINKTLEIGFYGAILLLSLANNLRIEGRKESLVDIKEII